MTDSEIARALESGARLARRLLVAGLIEAAVLRLSGEIVTVGARGVDDVRLGDASEPRNLIHA